MPKVSVIIPTYNYGRFVGKAIQSILDQTFPDFEVILVDDGSTDNTREVVSSFKDHRIKYMYQQNSGVSAAQNVGVRASRGDYIAILGSDDALLKDALEKEVAVLDKFTGVGLVYGQLSMVADDGTALGVIGSTFMNNSGIVKQQDQIKELLFHCRIIPSATMIRKCSFNEVGGFYEAFNIAEDLHLFIRLAKRYEVAYIAEPLVKWRIHPNSLRLNVNPKVAEKVFLFILEEVFDDPDLAPQFESLKSQAYSSSYRKIAGYAYGKDMKMVRRYFRKAVSMYPRILFCSESPSIVYRYITSLFPDKVWLAIRNLKRHFMPSKRL